jgi:RNA polymerase sigma-70 factor (ECF subfamily)
LSTDGHIPLRSRGPSPASQGGADAAQDLLEPADGEAEFQLDTAATVALVDQLFRAQSPQLLRFLSRRTRPEDAADLLQEAFLRLMRLFVGRAPPVRPEAYLQTIVGNLLRDRSRRRLLRGEIPLELPEGQQVVDPAPGPAAYLEAREMLRAYEASLLTLKPKTREVFLLHRIQGLTYGEIAVEVGLTVSGVEKQMMKAIAQIDRAMGRPL